MVFLRCEEDMTDTPATIQPFLRGSAGRLLVVILLSVIATCLLIQAIGADSSAYAQAGANSSRGIIAVAGQLSQDTYGMYLVDLESGTMSVYQCTPDLKRLRLVASRTFVYDLQLDEFNTEPAPREIKSMVEQHRRLGAETTSPAQQK